MRGLLLLLAGLVAVPAAAQTQSATPEPAAPAPALPRVALDTDQGRIVIEVDTVHAPISGNNFLAYVDKHRLDGAHFYRTVKVEDHFGFVQFGINNDPKKVLPPVKHEPTTLTGIKHTDFTVSTPRREPGSARGEFTIVLGDQPSFDADPSRPGDNLGYAAFGHVVDGKQVVETIFDAPVSPDKTIQGAFKGEVPVTQVTIRTARRLPTDGQ